MTQKEFIKILDEKKYSYEIEGNKIIVTHKGDSWLTSLTSIPAGVVFNNGGEVDLRGLTSISPSVEFNNKGYVCLDSLTYLPTGMEFRNEGNVFLKSLVRVSGLREGRFINWDGNIDGIDNKRLLNLMISKGLFER